MAVDERCDPEANTYLAALLTEQAFEYGDAKLEETPFGAILKADEKNLVYLLNPGKGTGVVEHPGIHVESAKYLGPVIGGYQPIDIFHKFQNNMKLTRSGEEEQKLIDKVVEHSVGERFYTVQPGKPGYFNGVHNPHDDVPIAVLFERNMEITFGA